MDNFSRTELIKYFNKSEYKPGEDVPIERKKIKKRKDEEEKKEEIKQEKKEEIKQEEENEYNDFALKTEELKNKAGNETNARETGD